MFAISLEACAPESLRADERVQAEVINDHGHQVWNLEVNLHRTLNSNGFNEVEIVATEEHVLLDFVYDHWVGQGGDTEWFHEIACTEIWQF